MAELKCKWRNTRDECQGEVRRVVILAESKSPIPIEICERHLKAHNVRMVLNKSGVNMEEMFDWRDDEIEKKAAEILVEHPEWKDLT